jgi:hypothetical protein
MKRFDLKYPCQADFGAMRVAPGGRFCDDCQTVVHDLSSMSEVEARALLEATPSERVCVRYVYDAASGEMVFGNRAESRSQLVPEHHLRQRLKRKIAMAAAIAAPLLVEACGGNDGNYLDRSGDPSLEQGNDDDVDGAAGANGATDVPDGGASPDAETGDT